MRHQINLFDETDGTPQPVSFSAVTIFVVAAVLIAGCLGMALFSQYRVRDVEADNKKVSALRAKLSAQYALAHKNDANGNAPDVNNEKLVSERDTLAAAALGLKTSDNAKKNGFSKYLKALTQKTPPGVAVALYELDSHGTLAISGKVASPDLLPALILELQDEAILKSRTFSRMEMHPSPDAADPSFMFELATSVAK